MPCKTTMSGYTLASLSGTRRKRRRAIDQDQQPPKRRTYQKQTRRPYHTLVIRLLSTDDMAGTAEGARLVRAARLLDRAWSNYGKVSRLVKTQPAPMQARILQGLYDMDIEGLGISWRSVKRAFAKIGRGIRKAARAVVGVLPGGSAVLSATDAIERGARKLLGHSRRAVKKTASLIRQQAAPTPTPSPDWSNVTIPAQSRLLTRARAGAGTDAAAPMPIVRASAPTTAPAPAAGTTAAAVAIPLIAALLPMFLK